jgi:hypothetical protein
MKKIIFSLLLFLGLVVFATTKPYSPIKKDPIAALVPAEKYAERIRAYNEAISACGQAVKACSRNQS